MCLKLKKSSKAIIAKRDIVCYKVLTTQLSELGCDKWINKPVTALLSNGCSLRGTLVKDNNGYFIIHKNVQCDGHRGELQLKANQYSWWVDDSVFRITHNGELIGKYTFVTPYQGSVVTIGNTYSSNLVKDEYNYIGKGLHSFCKRKDALESKVLRKVVVKCIIPKGSTYYKGKFGFYEYDSYASDKITYVKIIKY